MPTTDDRWPAFDYLECKESLDALHMQSQVVGKVKLALARPAPEWQQVPLWVNARGLTTGLLRAGGTELEIAFDLVGHRLDITTTDGRRDGFDLVARPLREFTAQVMAALARLGVRVTINPITVEVPNPVRCDEYEGCDAYDPRIAYRFFRVLAPIATVFEDFRAGFWGKQPPVSFFWGTFDLAVARFNLVPVPPSAGMDRIYRVAMDSELTEVGFWPGSERYPKPAFYAFTFPKPEGIERAVIRPERAGWNAQMGEFLLDYDDVRSSSDPRAAILEFANSTYAAGADLAGWDRTLLDRTPPK
jgi:Family of unknown function (DUF5996)